MLTLFPKYHGPPEPNTGSALKPSSLPGGKLYPWPFAKGDEFYLSFNINNWANSSMQRLKLHLELRLQGDRVFLTLGSWKESPEAHGWPCCSPLSNPCIMAHSGDPQALTENVGMNCFWKLTRKKNGAPHPST